MIRFLILRVLLPLLLFLLLRSFLHNLFVSRSRTPAPTRPAPPHVPAGGELRKDPVCGTYVSVLAGVREKVNGEVVYFCSDDCRRKYVPQPSRR
jgi:YHS domain-containing protein